MGKAIKKAQEIVTEAVETAEKFNEAIEAVETAEQPESHAVTVDELESIDMAAFAEQEQPDGSGGWRITDDSSADWAVRKIAEERLEFARLKALAEEQIARINEKVAAAEKRCENGTSFLTAKLAEYFETVPHKTTKTKHTYRLLSGTLAKKLGGVSMKQDDEKLVEFLKASGRNDMIKVTEKPKWGDYKKCLTIQGSLIIDNETGELVEGVTLEEKPDTFTVEV